MAKKDKREKNAPEGKGRRRDAEGVDTAAAKAAEAGSRVLRSAGITAARRV